MKDCLPSRLTRKFLGLCRPPGSEDGRTLGPDSTRSKILQVAFEEMYEHGYQGMRIENILVKTGLAKGALYHHFKNKKHLAYSVVDEVLKTAFLEVWEPVRDAENPLDEICRILREQCEGVTSRDILCGCPLNNLSQEMSGLDEGFKTRLSEIYDIWWQLLKTSLERAQAKGILSDQVDAETTSAFLISSIQGILGTVKCLQSKPMLLGLTDTLCDYIQFLGKSK